MRFAFVCLSLLLVVVGSAVADMEITVHSGWSFLESENQVNLCPLCLGPIDYTVTTTLHNSMMFGFKGGYYINRAMEVEGGFAVSPGHHMDQRGPFRFDVPVICIPEIPCGFPPFFVNSKAVAYQYEGNFVYNLHAGGATPYVTFGLGGISTDVGDSTHHDFALNYGAGAKFYFNNVGARFELNDHVIPNYFFSGKTEHDVQVQYGLVFRLN